MFRFVRGACLDRDSHAAQAMENLTALETAFKEMSVTVEVLKTIAGLASDRDQGQLDHGGIDRDLNKAPTCSGTNHEALTEQRKINQDQASKIMMDGWDCRVTRLSA